MAEDFLDDSPATTEDLRRLRYDFMRELGEIRGQVEDLTRILARISQTTHYEGILRNVEQERYQNPHLAVNGWYGPIDWDRMRTPEASREASNEGEWDGDNNRN